MDHEKIIGTMHDGRTNESVKRSRPLHRRWIDSSPTKGRQTFSPTFASFTSDHRPSHVSAKETEHPAGMPRLHSPSTENQLPERTVVLSVRSGEQ